MEPLRKAFVYSRNWSDPDETLKEIVKANEELQQAESKLTAENSWLQGWLNQASSAAPAGAAEGDGNAPDDVTGHTATPADAPKARKRSKKAPSH